MLPPPPQGDPLEILPPGIGNPEAWTVQMAFDAWRVFGSQALPQALADMFVLQGAPV
jgi:hypothetical protein